MYCGIQIKPIYVFVNGFKIYQPPIYIKWFPFFFSAASGKKKTYSQMNIIITIVSITTDTYHRGPKKIGDITCRIRKKKTYSQMNIIINGCQRL